MSRLKYVYVLCGCPANRRIPLADDREMVRGAVLQRGEDSDKDSNDSFHGFYFGGLGSGDGFSFRRCVGKWIRNVF